MIKEKGAIDLCCSPGSTTDRMHRKKNSQSENPFKSEEKYVPQNISRRDFNFKGFDSLIHQSIYIIGDKRRGRSRYLPMAKRLKELSLQIGYETISENKLRCSTLAAFSMHKTR